jgi:hypothetical protein
MSSWSSRRDIRGALSFISYAGPHVHVLLPPGTRLGVEPPQTFSPGEGLWRHAGWKAHEDVIVDLDAPSFTHRLTTATSMRMLGAHHRADVIALMRDQLEQARLITEPRDGAPVPDRSAARQRWLLMALMAESREAFADETFWQLDAPTGEVPDTVAPFVEERPPGFDHEAVVKLGALFLALIRMLWHKKVRQRQAVRYADLWALMESREPERGAAVHEDEHQLA